MDDLGALMMPFVAVIMVTAGAYFAVRWFGKRRTGGRAGRYIKIVDRAALGKDSQLVVVQVGTKTLLVSAAGQRVDALCELEPDELKEIADRPADKSFLDLLGASLGKGFQKNGANSLIGRGGLKK